MRVCCSKLWRFSLLFVLWLPAQAQPIVVSEYRNASGPAGEWTELLVVADNVDLRGYVLTDNNAGQTARQGGVRFANIPLWRHVRRGTVIVVHHRNTATVDTNAADGFLLLRAIDTTTYFEAVRYNTNFSWDNVALNIAQGGDILEILDAQGHHVYGLGHRANPGSYFQSMPFPKLNHPGPCASGGGISVTPGGSLADFTGGHTTGKTRFSYTDTTRGLPNNSGANLQFWRTLRQPQWNAPQLSAQLNAQATAVTLSWNAAVDPYPQDSVQGYMILRSTQPMTAQPQDGRTYNNGASIGNAVVVAHIASSQQTTYVDHLAQPLPCGDTLFYRVYAYRFATDQLQGNAYHLARGRAYNEAAFAAAFVTPQFPGTPQLQATATEICQGDTVTLQAAPQGTGYQYRWFRDGTLLQQTVQPNLKVTEAGNYTVRVIAPNGCEASSNGVAITVKPRPQVSIQPVADQCFRTHRYDFHATVVPNDGVSYHWFFADDASVTTSTAAAPTGIFYHSPGLKMVRLVVERQGCWSDTAVLQFRVLNSPEVEIQLPDPLILCLGDSIKMDIAVSGSNLKFRWEPPTWFSDSTAFEPWFYARQTGTHRIRVRVIDTVENCEAQDTIRVLIFPPPEATINPSGTVELCEGESVELKASPTSGQDLYEYHWIPGGAQSSSITVFQPGKYRVVVRNKTTGCQDTSDWVNVVVHPLPDTIVTVVGGQAAFCPGDTLYLEAPAGDGYTYRWNTGATGRRLAVTQPGNYWVETTTPYGCRRRSQVVQARYWDVQYQLSQNALDFGSLGECETEKALTVALQNVGVDTVTVTAVVPPGFAVVPATLTIPPGRDRIVTVRFLPLTAGIYADTIVFHSAPCPVQRLLYVQGRKEQSELQISTSSVDFPILPRCAQPYADTVIVIRNEGTATVRFDSIRIAPPFQLLSPLSFPQFRIPGDSLVLRLRFAPVSDGVFTQNVKVYYETAQCQASVQLVLNGRSVMPSFEITPVLTAVDFPMLQGCETQRDTMIAVRNSSAVPLYVNAAVSTPHFQLLPPLADTLQPGEERTVRVVFQPQTEGIFTDTLVVAETMCGKQVRIGLYGVKQGVSVRVSAQTLDFGTVVFPCTAVPLDTVITVQNGATMTTATVRLDSVRLRKQLAVFRILATSNVVLPPGNAYEIPVQFVPDQSGSWEDTLQLWLQPCNLVRTVVIRGQAVQAAVQPLATGFDFGTLPVGQSQNTTLLFRNTGDVPIEIVAIGGIVPPFALVNVTPPLPALLQPQEEVAVEVQFAPVTAAIVSMQLFVEAQVGTQCTITSSSISVTGSGELQIEPAPVTVQMQLPQLQARPEENVEIPIVLHLPGADTVQVDSLAFTLLYDGSLLMPYQMRTGTLTPSWQGRGTEVAMGRFVVELAGPPITDTLGTVAVITAKVLLSPNRRTPITVDTASLFFAIPQQYRAIVSVGAGEFVLEDTCALRPEDIGWTEGMRVQVDVPHASIALFLPLDQPAEIAIFDLTGKRVYQQMLPPRSGDYRYAIPELPAGMYILRVQQSPYISIVPLVIVR